MSECSLPDYGALLKRGPSSRPHARKILGLLLESGRELHVFEDETLRKLFPDGKYKKSTVENNILVLERYNFIVKERRGPIRLKYKTPLCWLANTPGTPFAYLGLLGERRYPVSETETAIELLKSDPNVGVKPEKIIVLTTKKVVGQWEEGISPDLKISWETTSEEDLNDIDKVEEFIKPIICDLMRNYILIMDLTSGPRPAGIAFYELAIQFKVPLIYVYEPKKKLRWLISREKLEKEIGGVLQMEPREKGDTYIESARRRRIVY
jgi:hypothetical protein